MNATTWTTRTNAFSTSSASTPTSISTTSSFLAIRPTFTAKQIVLITLYVLIFIAGVGGNCSVLAFFKRKTKRTLYDTYILNLAIADIIASLIAPPRAIFTMIMHDDGVFFDKAGCKILSVIEPISVNASSWILTSIAIERYRGIVQPLKPRFRRSHIRGTVLMIWLMSLVSYIPYIISMTVVGKHCLPRWYSPVEELAFNVAVLMLQSLIPMAIMCFTLLRIGKAMEQRREALIGTTKRSFTKELNLLLVLKVAFVVFTICTLPYNIFYIILVYDLGMMKRFARLHLYIEFNDWLAILVLMSSVTNCFVYAGLHKDFMKYRRQCLRRGNDRKKPASKMALTTMTDKFTLKSTLAQKSSIGQSIRTQDWKNTKL
eukprot:Seg1289.12 transcript_id=Seg1289.12/GoldUCD/mRNA.D3Y31 product="Tachykinin-like peptides receptor 86C" protein_id=Seg1289.12/GoldUCD/D3Y31